MVAIIPVSMIFTDLHVMGEFLTAEAQRAQSFLL